MGLFLMIVFGFLYFGYCFLAGLMCLSSNAYLYSLHLSKFTENLPFLLTLTILLVLLLFISKTRMNRFEYEYELGKIQEKKYQKKKKKRVNFIVWVIVFSLWPLVGQLWGMASNGVYLDGYYLAYEVVNSKGLEDSSNEKEKVCYITDIEALPFVTKIEIPETIKEYSVVGIKEGAFEHYRALKDVTIPSSVATIGEGAFLNCTKLENVRISDVESWCAIEFDSIPLSYGGSLYLNDEKITNLVIPESVTKISYGAFYGCNSLVSVTIPSSVEEIEPYAFKNCTSLTEAFFESPEDWYLRVDVDPSKWISYEVYYFSATDLASPSVAAKYLRQDCADHLWFQK